MPTGSKRINVYNKRLFSFTSIGEQFYQFLRDEIAEAVSAVFQGASGVLDTDEIEIIVGSANNKFSLDLTNAEKVVVGTGHVLDLSEVEGASKTQNIQFENETGVTYYVGARFMEKPVDMELNPRTGDPEYSAFEQTIGEKLNPDSITDHTTYIRLIINSLTEDGVNYSGRTARVWLDNPVSGLDSVAFYEGFIQYAAGDNYIDIPYSGADGPLGQDTGANPPSLIATDYWVCIEGVTWSRGVDLRAIPQTYAFLGIITGGSPPTFDISDQNPVYINTLQRAYDGVTGSGSGRLIQVANKAVELRARAGNTDEHRTVFRIDRKGDTQAGGIGFEVIMDGVAGAGILSCKPLTHVAGSLELNNPMVVNDSNTIARTNTANFQTANVEINDLAWIDGTPGSDGLFVISVIGPATLDVTKLDGTAPALVPTETGTLTILRPIFSSSSEGFGPSGWPRLNAFNGPNESTTDPAAHFFPREGKALKVYNSLPSLRSEFGNNGLLSTPQVSITPLAVTNINDDDGGLLLNATNLSQKKNQVLSRQFDPYGNCCFVQEPYGRIARPHFFEDDFFYHQSRFSSKATPPFEYDCSADGAGDVFQSNTFPISHGGCCELVTGATIGDKAQIQGSWAWSAKSDISKLRFMARYALHLTNGERIDNIGIKGALSGWYIFFTRSSGGLAWYFEAYDGTHTFSTSIAGDYTADNFLNMYFAFSAPNVIKVWMTGMTTEVACDVSTALIDFTTCTDIFRLYCQVEATASLARKGLLDYWAIHDQQVLHGDMGVAGA